MDQGMRQGLERLKAAVDEAAGLLDGVCGSVDLLEAVRHLDAMERITHGIKLQVLAEADQRKAARAGIQAWLAAQLGYGNGRARALAEEARRIGALPELTGKLTAGELNQDGTRVAARAAKAAEGAGRHVAEAVTETLTVIERDGITKARAGVRVLEETLAPGHVKDLTTRQRARSFLRTAETGEGLVRIDALLDARRGTRVRAAPGCARHPGARGPGPPGLRLDPHPPVRRHRTAARGRSDGRAAGRAGVGPVGGGVPDRHQ